MQNYMFLGLKSPYKAIFSLHFVQMVLSAFAILAGLVASGSVFLNDLYFWGQSAHYINPYLCLTAFLLAFSPRAWGLAAVICLLPLSAGLGTQLNAYLGTEFLILPNAGLDLVAGFFLGLALRKISKTSHFLGKNGHGDLTAAMKELAPWPIALVIVMITISTAIAISRNVYQSAAATSFKGLLFNLAHFRPIGWHDDYMPISDWIAYALAVAMIVVVIGQPRDRENKNQIIFRPIMAGLIIAALMGISQAITGIGLPENLLSFRKDQLGYAVIGFQPDLHAFAGHMLLGVVGLWGYFCSGISKLERRLVMLVVSLCWIGLILSKSRALLLLALAAMFVWLVWYLWKNKRRAFLPAISILATILTIFVVFIFNFSNDLSGIPVLFWLGELANEFKSRDLTSWSLFSGIFGSRFEIWEAAIRMWWEFPLMGIGQGNFYRLSDIASFSKSHFLILNHGENAHNYFLQTLTETGLVGIAVFVFALLAPLYSVKDKRILIPGAIAILSLFLGNIFSHSFLVRENFFLAAILFGLIYAQSQVKPSSLEYFSTHSKNFGVVKKLFFLQLLSVFYLLSLVVLEITKSFGSPPFEYGRYCFISKSAKGSEWTSGSFEILIPSKFSRAEVMVKAPWIGKDRTTVLKVEQINCAGDISKNHFNIGSNFPQLISVKNLRFFCNSQSYLRFSVSECFTPRNIGENIDGRRLGVFINEEPKLYE